jgi:hypothetical protein
VPAIHSSPCAVSVPQDAGELLAWRLQRAPWVQRAIIQCGSGEPSPKLCRGPARTAAPLRPRDPQIDDLKKGIATFYDESSGLWEEVWGEHMHHGEPGRGSGSGRASTAAALASSG